MAAYPGPARWYHAIPPHLFLFCFIVVLGSTALANALPRLTGEVLAQETLEPGVPLRFHVPEAGTPVWFDVTATFALSPEVPQNASLVLRKADGTLVWNASVDVHGIPDNTREPDAKVLLAVPVLKPEAPGDYELTYQFHDGTPSTESVKITQGGLSIKHGPRGFLFYVLTTLFVVGFAMLFLVRGGTPDGKGLERFFPVRGATKLSLAITAVLAFLSTWVVLYVGGGGLA